MRGVRATGLFSGAVLWWRKDAPALSASEVPWGLEEIHPYVLELEIVVEDAAGVEGAIPVTFTWPSPVHPEAPEALPHWRALFHRAALHEADEALRVGGVAPFDPHATARK